MKEQQVVNAPAGHWWRRIHAECIDLFIIFLVSSFLYKFLYQVMPDVIVQMILRTGLFLLVLFAYDMAFLQAKSRSTWGMRLLYLKLEPLSEKALTLSNLTSRWIIKYTPLWMIYCFEMAVRFSLISPQLISFVYLAAVTITLVWAVMLIFSPLRQALHDLVSNFRIIDVSEGRKIHYFTQWVIRPPVVAVLGLFLIGVYVLFLQLDDEEYLPEMVQIIDDREILKKRFQGVYWLFGMDKYNPDEILSIGEKRYHRYKQEFFNNQRATVKEIEQLKDSSFDYRDVQCYLMLLPADKALSCTSEKEVEHVLDEKQPLIQRYRQLYHITPLFIEADVAYIYGPLMYFHMLDMLDLVWQAKQGHAHAAIEGWKQTMQYWLHMLDMPMGYMQTYIAYSNVKQALAVLPVIAQYASSLIQKEAASISAILQSAPLQPKGWRWDQLVKGSVFNWDIAESWFRPNLLYLPRASRNDIYLYLSKVWEYYYSLSPAEFVELLAKRKLERPGIYQWYDMLYNPAGKNYVGTMGHEHTDPHLLELIYYTSLYSRMVGAVLFTKPEELQTSLWRNFFTEEPFRYDDVHRSIIGIIPGKEAGNDLVLPFPVYKVAR